MPVIPFFTICRKIERVRFGAALRHFKVTLTFSETQFHVSLDNVDRSKCQSRQSADGKASYKEVKIILLLHVELEKMILEVKVQGKTDEVLLEDLEFEDNPNPALGSLITRDLVVPATHTQSLLALENEHKRQRKAESKRKDSKRRKAKAG